MKVRFAILTLLALAAAAGPAEAQLTFLQQWGNPGPPDPVSFPPPHSIAVGPSGRVYLVVEKRWIYVYYPDGQVYTQVWTGLAMHFDIVVDAAENFYVASWDNNIKRYNSAGGPITFTDEAELSSPTGLALDGAGHIYVADSGNFRIQKLLTDGTFVDRWGNQGTGPGQFVGPVDVELGQDGNVYVVDNGGGIRRIQVFTPDGDFIREFPYTICGGTDTIRGIAFDSSNNIFAAGGTCLTKMDSNGNLLYSYGSAGTGEGQFLGLYDVTVDQGGYIYTAESTGSRIQKFQEEGVPVLATTWGGLKARAR